MTHLSDSMAQANLRWTDHCFMAGFEGPMIPTRISNYTQLACFLSPSCTKGGLLVFRAIQASVFSLFSFSA